MKKLFVLLLATVIIMSIIGQDISSADHIPPRPTLDRTALAGPPNSPVSLPETEYKSFLLIISRGIK